MLIQNYHQKLEGGEDEDETDEKEDTSKMLEVVVRKRTLSAKSNEDNPSNETEENKKMNGVSKMNGVEKKKGKKEILKGILI